MGTGTLETKRYREVALVRLATNAIGHRDSARQSGRVGTGDVPGGREPEAVHPAGERLGSGGTGVGLINIASRKVDTISLNDAS
jgi:hypothetical protein